MKRPLFEALDMNGVKIEFVTVFSRSELSSTPIQDLLPEKYYDTVEVWYAVLNEIEINCIIGQHRQIQPDTLRYIGDL